MINKFKMKYTTLMYIVMILLIVLYGSVKEFKVNNNYLEFPNGSGYYFEKPILKIVK